MKFSRYYFHMKANILPDFQICISLPLKALLQSKFNKCFHVSKVSVLISENFWQFFRLKNIIKKKNIEIFSKQNSTNKG